MESGLITDFHILSSSKVEATENVALNGWKVIGVVLETDSEKVSERYADYNIRTGKT